MLQKTFVSSLLLLAINSAKAQQFVGLSFNKYAAVQQMPYNPAWVNNAMNGTEIHLFSASALAGTNAYRFSKAFAGKGFGGQAIEGSDYFKDVHTNKKHIWGNIDVLGPAISIAYKNNIHLGLYTRMRQVMRAGNLNNAAFQLIGDVGNAKFPDTAIRFENTGFTTSTFAEVGISVGKVLNNDFYHVLKAGVTVKYVMGFSAGSLFTGSTEVTKHTADSLNTVKGSVSVLYSSTERPYTDNDFSNDLGSWFNRSGKGSLGLDIGFQYEYHPNGDPNQETPYSYSIAASITDLGSVAYKADTGSGQYELQIKNKAMWQFNRQPYEDNLGYFYRLSKDTMIKRSSEATSFRISLPTAFRLNTDWNIDGNIWVAASILLNLKGNNGDVYRPGYVNSFNITPRYEKDWLMVGFPVSYWGYQTMGLGFVFRAGPLFLGSSSIISTLLSREVRNADGYAGLVLKIKKRNTYYTY
jgi:hypothetical protein